MTAREDAPAAEPVCEPRTLALLYSPADWFDPGWWPVFDVAPTLPRAVSNRLLLARSGLAWRDLAALAEPGVRRLMRDWQDLSLLSYLCGARLMRDEILRRNALAQLRYGAAVFLALPWGGAAPDTALSPETDIQACIEAQGGRCVQSAYAPLPADWTRRLRFLLPPEAGIDEAAAPRIDPVQRAASRRLLSHARDFLLVHPC